MGASALTTCAAGTCTAAQTALAKLPNAFGLGPLLAGAAAHLAGGPTPFLAFGLTQALVAASGVMPASLVAIAAGASLGFGYGFVLCALGTLFGGWVAFVLARSVLRPLVARWLSRRKFAGTFDAAVRAEGWKLVLLMRISPVMPFALTSYALGLSKVRQRDFLIGSLASLPALAGYVAVGALGRMGTGIEASMGGALRAAAIVFGIGTVLWASRRVANEMKKLAAES